MFVFSQEFIPFFDDMPNYLSVLSFISLLFVASCSHIKDAGKYPWDELTEGDLAFRCGRGLFSRVVTATEDDGLYSHVGIVVKEDGKWKVVHAVPGERDFKGDFDRVKMDDLEVFFGSDRSNRGCIVHTGLTEAEKIESICTEAIKLAHDSVLFDNDYNLDDSTMLYCSEMVWLLYKHAGIDLTEGRRRHINVIHISGDVILPEHIFRYSNNEPYFYY